MPIPNSIDELSTNPAENYPAGTEPVFPNLDNYLRFHAACIAQLRNEVKASGLALCGTRWWGGSRSAIALPMKAIDGDLLSRADYPEMWSFVAAGGWPVVTEATWQADKLKRASFSSGDGATTFRMPDFNGKQQGSIGAVVLRGDGGSSAGAAGLLQDSQNLEHGHAAEASQTGAHVHAINGTTGNAGQHSHGFPNSGKSDTRGLAAAAGDNSIAGYTQTSDAGDHSHSFSGSASSSGTHAHVITIAASGGGEARGKAATGCHVMRVK